MKASSSKKNADEIAAVRQRRSGWTPLGTAHRAEVRPIPRRARFAASAAADAGPAGAAEPDSAPGRQRQPRRGRWRRSSASVVTSAARRAEQPGPSRFQRSLSGNATEFSGRPDAAGKSPCREGDHET